MALIKHENKIQLECDLKECKKCTKVYGKNEFLQMINHAKKDGWKIFKKGGKFVHYCDWMHTP